MPFSKESSLMSTVLYILVLVAMFAVLMVLIRGLFNMMRGGSPNRSQTLMRWRVILQFVAVCVIMGAIWYSQTS